MIFNTISLVTSICRLTKTESDSERVFTKRENKVSLFNVMHVAHDAKCFSLCVYSYLHLQQFDICFFLSQKCQPMDRMTIEYRNRNQGLIEGGPDPDFDPS